MKKPKTLSNSEWDTLLQLTAYSYCNPISLEIFNKIKQLKIKAGYKEGNFSQKDIEKLFGNLIH